MRKKIKRCVADPEFQGHIPHVEFYKNFLRFSQNQIYIVPTKNMVSNIGTSANSVHSADNINKLPKATQRLFNTQIFNYLPPVVIRAPEFVIRDLFYEDKVNYLLAWNRPFLKFCRRIEAAIRHAIYGDWSRIKRRFFEILRHQNCE